MFYGITRRRKGFFLLLFCGIGIIFYTCFSLIMISNNKLTTKMHLFEELGRKHSGLFIQNNESKTGVSHVTEVKRSRTSVLDHHYMVVTETKGRLGNHLFQFAALIGTAHYHGYIPVMMKAASLRNIFDITVKSTVPHMNHSKSFSEKRAGIYDRRIVNLTHSANWTLHGFFQSWKYFDEAIDVVRNQLKFKKSIIYRAKKLLPTKQNHETRIGVHVRRGDMNSKYSLKRGFNVADVGFLNRSMNYFRKRFQNVTFIVVSEDVKWCKKNLKTEDITIMTSSRENDLAILSLCDHNIVTSGTFGWWGAWLAGGETVYFKDFPRNNSWLDKQYSKTDYYPPSWIGMV